MHESSANTKLDEYLTKRQVADSFQVTERCIDQWMKQGILPYFKLSKAVRFSRESIQKHIEEKFLRNGRAA
jgi:predicted DNA-binding transcriptional regulator AlpA